MILPRLIFFQEQNQSTSGIINNGYIIHVHTEMKELTDIHHKLFSILTLYENIVEKTISPSITAPSLIIS